MPQTWWELNWTDKNHMYNWLKRNKQKQRYDYLVCMFSNLRENAGTNHANFNLSVPSNPGLSLPHWNGARYANHCFSLLVNKHLPAGVRIWISASHHSLNVYAYIPDRYNPCNSTHTHVRMYLYQWMCTRCMPANALQVEHQRNAAQFPAPTGFNFQQ